MSDATPADQPCPSCGRNFGPRARCVYCAATREGRVEVGRIQRYAYPLLLAAVFCFYQAMFATPTYRDIATLGEKDNFRRVRVRGEVRSVRVFTDKYQRGTSVVLSLAALDEGEQGSKPGGAEIRLKADGRIGHELKTEGRVPSIGEILDVSASVFAGKGYRLLSLNSARNLKVVGATDRKVVYTEATVEEILADPEAFRDKAVALPRAKVVKAMGSFHLGVSAEGGSEILRVYGEKPQFYRPDDIVSLRGKWTKFKPGQPWELKVESGDPSGCVVLVKSDKPALEAAPRKPRDVTVAELLAGPDEFRDQRVKVGRAVVVEVRGNRSMDVRDEAGTGTLAVFGIDPWYLEPGDVVAVTGKLSKYEKKNRWEIKADRGRSGSRVLEKKNPDRKKATMAQLLAAPGDHEGAKVVVYKALVAEIVDATSFRAGDPEAPAPESPSPSAPASDTSTASAASSATTTGSAPASETSTAAAPSVASPPASVLVRGTETRYLREGAAVKLRGTFVRHPDGSGWEIQIAEGDGGAVRTLRSRRPAGRKGR